MEGQTEYVRYAHFDKVRGCFKSIHPSEIAVKLCDGKEPKTRYRITLVEEIGGGYFGFLYNKTDWKPNGGLGMIFRTRLHVDVCFDEGLEKAIARGKGRLIELKVVKEEIVFQGS